MSRVGRLGGLGGLDHLLELLLRGLSHTGLRLVLGRWLRLRLVRRLLRLLR